MMLKSITELPNLVWVYAICMFVSALLGFRTGGGQEFFGLLAAGTAYGIFQLIGIWSVLGTGKYLVRSFNALAMSGIVGASALAGLAIALSVSNQKFAVVSKDFGQLICMLPILYAIVQIPSWFFRLCFGWRIAHESEVDSPENEAISIFDMMLFTTFCAIGLACLQFGRSDFFVQPETGSQIDLSMRMVLGGSLFLVGPYLIIFLPGFMSVLNKGAASERRVFLVVGILMALFIVIVILVLFFAPSVSSRKPVEFGLLASTMLAFFYPLLSLRKQGYVLARGRRRTASTNVSRQNE